MHSTLEVARLLIARGGDPNAGFLWRGLVPPFTAITGAFGEGEDGNNQGPHRHCEELVRLLLEAGADPNDGQALYNRHFRRDDGHLRLLLAYGLGRDKGGPWYEQLGERMQSPARLLVEELWSAARKGFAERTRLLVEHGVDLNTPGLRDGRTPYEAALRAGQHEIATYLLEHGARKVELNVKEAFAAALIGGRRAEARAFLERTPNLLEQLGRHRRIELLHRAVEGDRLDGLRLMAELGFEMGGMTTHDLVGMNLNATPLHNAAWKGNLEMVRLLLELGADPRLREPSYNGTPRDWAAHNHQEHVVAYLEKLDRPYDQIPAYQEYPAAGALRTEAVADSLGRVGHGHPGEELQALVAELARHLEAKGSAVVRGDVRAVHAVGEQGLGVEGVVHVDAVPPLVER